jgi:2-polyprenyl-3-methyl-5-hydroxy-6-metoxy-1,4-benzoquinol methylase
MESVISSAPHAVSETDQTLISELLLLESSMERNYDWVYSIIEPFLGHSLLEVGSGVGVISRHIVERGDPVVLSDHHPVYLEYLKSRFRDYSNVSYQILDLNSERYDVGGRQIDTIVCLNVLEHIEDDMHVLRGFAGLLPPGGRVVLQVPNYPALFGSLDASYGHFRRYTRRVLAERLGRAGFRVVSLRNFNPLAIPGWIVSAKILRAKTLDIRSTRLFNAFVPIARRLDFLSRFGGLALIACGERVADS